MRVTRFKPAAPAPGAATLTIEALVPTSAYVDLRDNVSESTMLPAEALAIAGALPERRFEFATVRHCARQALARIGIPPAAIIPDADGAPRWPAGVVGSMTHCAGYRAAVVARSDRLRGIGIDAEAHAALPRATRDLVLRREERARLRTLAEAEPDVHWDCICFCAKEAVYKAWFPSTRRWLDFADISVTVHAGGTFQACLLGAETDTAGADREVLAGRWVVSRGLVVAGTSVAR
ncbi:MAG TPA: 4'-phosphopantetheinyl transferase superfamily protein [Gaiellales bacterium]|nr:4'-phosphopantetheinyl transferase superfamily protein [Gaiellales bacterium]